MLANTFADFGIAVIDTDVIAKQLVQPGEPALEEIRQRFGDSVMDADGGLDRAAMRTLIFSDASARTDLEDILHPRIAAETRERARTQD